MKKNSIKLSFLSLILTSVIILTCGCSSNQPFEYDWTAIDNLMNENGVEYSTYLNQTYLEIFNSKNDDTEMICKLVKYETIYDYEYRLWFETSYYNLIPDIIVVTKFYWSLPYLNPAEDYSFTMAYINYYENGEKTLENYKIYKWYVVDNLKFKDEQFESCEYLESPWHATQELIGNIELAPSNEYYLEHLLSVGFNKTTEFFKNNNLPSLYVFTERIPLITVSDRVR